MHISFLTPRHPTQLARGLGIAQDDVERRAARYAHYPLA